MRRGRSVMAAVAAGLGAGLVARLFFIVLPDPWNTLANTSALWGLAPFFVALGVRTRGRSSAALGILSLTLVVATWTVLAPTGVTPRELVMWVVVAIVAGALCGLAGGLALDARAWLRRAALAFIGGLVMGEGLYGLLVIGGPQWWFELVVGLALPLVLARRWPDRLIAAAGASVVACALFGAYLLYDAIAVG